MTRFFCFLLLLLPCIAEAQVTIESVKGGQQRIPILMRTFQGPDDVRSEMQNTVQADLGFTGFFEFVEVGTLDSTRARAAIFAVMEDEGNALHGFIVDPAQGVEIASYDYEIMDNDYRDAAHRFSDDIVYILSGSPGLARTKVLFVRGESGGAKGLYTVDWDGQNIRSILSDGFLNLTPAWAPDGAKILFTSYRADNPDLYWRDIRSGEGGVVSNYPGLNTAPAWSPDGKKVAFVISKGSNSDIYVMNRDGSRLKRITHSPAIDTDPTWAPSGRQVAFTSDRSGSPQIYRMNVDGSDVQRLTFDKAYNASPVWSPDGERIAFVTREEGGFQIRVLDLTDQESYLLTVQSGNNEDPAWSPDGRYLVFSSTRSGARRLHVMDADGTNVRTLTPGNFGAASPCWSPRTNSQ